MDRSTEIEACMAVTACTLYRRRLGTDSDHLMVDRVPPARDDVHKGVARDDSEQCPGDRKGQSKYPFLLFECYLEPIASTDDGPGV